MSCVGTLRAVSVAHGCFVYYDYISAWGYCVARFNGHGNAKASMCEASDNELHAFFMSEKNYEKITCRVF